MIGAGQKSCGTFIAAVHARGTETPVGSSWQTTAPNGAKMFSEITRFQEWMMGFVTGYNHANESDVDLQISIDLAALDLWLRNYCKQNPTKTVVQAAGDFRAHMTSRR
jgi:hypothetical protein